LRTQRSRFVSPLNRDDRRSRKPGRLSGATPRFSFSASVPLLLASRRSNNSPYTTATQGIGDSILTAQGWLWNPRENTRGNVAFSLGVMLPTGNDHVMNRVDSFNGKGPQDVVLQPGSGGYGIVF
jgi:hypothetical protein